MCGIMCVNVVCCICESMSDIVCVSMCEYLWYSGVCMCVYPIHSVPLEDFT